MPGPGIMEKVVEERLAEMGKERQELGIDTLVANIVDAMERMARNEGKSTYYTGTYIINPHTLANAGLTCEMMDVLHHLDYPDRLRWTAFVGIDEEVISRKEAIQYLLNERS